MAKYVHSGFHLVAFYFLCDKKFYAVMVVVAKQLFKEFWLVVFTS